MSGERWTTPERITKRAGKIGVRCGEGWGQRYEGRFVRLGTIAVGSLGAASVCPRWLAVVVVFPVGAQEGAQACPARCASEPRDHRIAGSAAHRQARSIRTAIGVADM